MSDIYIEVIREFNRKKVNYIVIGVSGINYYAEDAHHLIMTADFDIFLEPETDNVIKALKILKEKEFSIASGKGLVRRISREKIKTIVEKGLTLTASNPYGNMLDLCLEVSGFTFEQLYQNANIFRAGRTPIKVGSIHNLLRMKEIADRGKDRLFLEKYNEVF